MNKKLLLLGIIIPFFLIPNVTAIAEGYKDGVILMNLLESGTKSHPTIISGYHFTNECIPPLCQGTPSTSGFDVSLYVRHHISFENNLFQSKQTDLKYRFLFGGVYGSSSNMIISNNIFAGVIIFSFETTSTNITISDNIYYTHNEQLVGNIWIPEIFHDSIELAESNIIFSNNVYVLYPEPTQTSDSEPNSAYWILPTIIVAIAIIYIFIISFLRVEDGSPSKLTQKISIPKKEPTEMEKYMGFLDKQFESWEKGGKK